MAEGENNSLSPKLRTLKKTCSNCGKEFTINTIDPKEDLNKHSDLCPACKDPGFNEKMKRISELWNKEQPK